MHHPRQSWMALVLWSAASYNFAWGVCVILFAESGFRLAGLQTPRYPESWQILGILVALNGLAFGLAAADPFRHWPLILLGLLGKAAAPVAFAGAALHGTLPSLFLWSIICSDVIWWFPLALILVQAWQAHIEWRRLQSPDVVALALRMKTDQGLSIRQFSTIGPVMVIFLRHSGCMFCRQALADISRQRQEIERAGTSLLVVHMGDEKQGTELLRKYSLADVPRISDPECNLYRAFGLRRCDFRMLLSPRVWWLGLVAAFFEGHGLGRLVGDVFQMPGVFLIFHGQVIRSYRHQSAADRPDYAAFAGTDVAGMIS